MLEIDKIYNEDCLEGMKQIEDRSIDLIVTDPPYGISYKTSRRKGEHKFKHEIANDDNFDFIEKYIEECYRILKDDTACYMFCSAKTLPFFLKTTQEKGFSVKNTIIWDKGNWTAGDLEAQFGQQYEPLLLLNKGRCKINGKRLGDIWRFPRVPSTALIHQNEKPIDLIRNCVLCHSEMGGVVFDGCMGSATTAIACIKEKRHYLGFELDKEYYDKACKRIQQERMQPTLF